MKKISFFASLMLLQLLASAQLSSFNLKSFKLPELKRRQLVLSFDGASANQSNYINKNSTNTLQAKYNISYRYIKSNEKWQIDDTINFFYTTNAANLETQSTQLTSNYRYLYQNITSTNRYYLKDKFFLEFNGGYKLQSAMNYNEESYIAKQGFESTTQQWRKNNTIHQQSNLATAIGYGRIDPVQDAQMAVYLLQDLAESGKLSREPTQEEILALSTLIAQLRNKRLFDSRKRIINQLTQIDSLLQANNLLEHPDMKSSAIISDNWNYAYNPIRYSGFRVSINQKGDFLNSRYRNEGSGNSDNLSALQLTQPFLSQFVTTTSISSILEDPINRRWQQTFIVTPYYSKYFARFENGIVQKGQKTSLGCTIGYNLAFYPNSRTIFTWTNRASAWSSKATDVDQTINFSDNRINQPTYSQGEPPLNVIFSTGLLADYYISPRIRLNASIKIIYNNTQTNAYDVEFPSFTNNGTQNLKYFSHNSAVQFIYYIL